jgi:hypothetical protein
MSVIAVYNPLDEVTARALLAALEAEGIRAELRQFHNPWEISWLEGRPWGQILVLEEDAEHAHQVIKDFLASIENSSSDAEEGESS